MIKDISLAIPPEKIGDQAFIKEAAAGKLGLSPETIDAVQIRDRSIDARGRKYQVHLLIYKEEDFQTLHTPVRYTPGL